MVDVKIQFLTKSHRHKIIMIMKIYAAPKLSKYMTALGAYNVKSFTYQIINTRVRW